MRAVRQVSFSIWFVPVVLTLGSMLAAHQPSRSILTASLVAAMAGLKARWFVTRFMDLGDRCTAWSRALVAWAVALLAAAVLAQVSGMVR